MSGTENNLKKKVLIFRNMTLTILFLRDFVNSKDILRFFKYF